MSRGPALIMTKTQADRVDVTTTDKPTSSAKIIPDCLEHVFQYLNTADKGRSAQVCRLWRATCYRKSVWKSVVAKISLSRMSDDVLRSIHERGIRKLRISEHRNNLEWVTRRFHSLQGLDISGCHYTRDETLLKAFGKEMRDMRELNFSYCTGVTDLGVSSAVEKCPNLETLILQGCSNVRLNDAAKWSLNRCKRLHTLTMSWCKQINISSFRGLCDKEKEDSLIQLKHLNLKDCDHICDACLTYISDHFKTLESLNISFCISVTDEGLEAIAKGLPKLTVLKLQAVDNISSSGLRYVATRCTELKHLDIGFCDWVNDDCLEKLSNGKILDTLGQLNLACAHITDEGIRIIAESFHQLKHLNIGQCQELTDQCLSHIRDNLVNLVSIDVYGCHFSESAVSNVRDTLSNLKVVNSVMISDNRQQITL